MTHKMTFCTTKPHKMTYRTTNDSQNEASNILYEIFKLRGVLLSYKCMVSTYLKQILAKLNEPINVKCFLDQ